MWKKAHWEFGKREVEVEPGGFVEDALSPSELAEAMAHAGLAAGLPALEVQRTITSALGVEGAA